ncbi:hypothetical protein BKH43_08020 [Helicobacter sp. 13S00401-1]|uniref:hypothetical protein n=1 Tax=Helicobacter sp. 13S00401-1 TaxID=1905758 RepID=UPI000BA67860|nr:hypothetical protein [Helicobacter sp. 13S00401-1]PAF47988.1 hypothetical protein BKH43_08020 [Helicobacter sp. 13S00401-1]
MHGKILKYSATTSSGVIINASKKIFELRKESWHDPRSRPTVGMYVEFRVNENGYIITDAKASAYQHFSEDSLIKEIDFWKTKTDEELKNKENEARAQIAQKIYAKTNYLKIKTLEVNTSVQECIKNYFAVELQSVAFLKTVDKEKLAPLINYRICKRFLDKALDYLVFTDKKLSMDMFAEYLNKMATLEYSYVFFHKNEINIQKAFEDCFLEYQYNYLGALRAASGVRDRILQLSNKVKTSTQEMKILRNRMASKVGENDLNERINKIKTMLNKSYDETNALTSTLTNLENLTKDFKEKNFKVFEEAFSQTTTALKAKIEEGLNVLATQLDNRIWQLGMESVSIKNIFFKNMNEPYCMMTFLGHMIKKLDKSKIIAQNEQSTYKYYYYHQNKYVKKYLIFTSNFDTELNLKIKIMKESKNNNVVVVKKDSQCFSALNKEKFEKIYIDTSYIDQKSLKQLLEDSKHSKYNKDTEYILLSKN